MPRLLVICLVILVGCGGERVPVEEPVDDAGEDGTRLVVEVRASPEGPVQRRVVDELPPGVSSADFEPVPANVACAEIYGGPATARVAGTLAGQPIDATFNRINACEMARWDRVEALLGRAPAQGP